MANGTLFETAIGAFGGGVATASVGGGGSSRPGAAMAMAPGSSMASGGGGGSPFAPTHPAGVAFWVGIISVALLARL
jgi:hypothetical protein